MQFAIVSERGAMRLGYTITDAFGPFDTAADAKRFISTLVVEGPYHIIRLADVREQVEIDDVDYE